LQATQKKSKAVPSNEVSAAAVTSASDEKGDLSIAFSVQGTGGSPTGPDPQNRVGDQNIGSPDRPISRGLQVLGEPGRCGLRARPTW